MRIEATPQDQSPDKALNPKMLRGVLKDWNLLKALGEHFLTKWDIVKDRRQVTGYTPTVAGRGLALREVLQSALETLKPDDGPPQPQEKRWRPYFILIEQYVHGRNPDWVQQQLHVSKGTYYSEQERALAMLVSVLQRWEEEYPRHAEINNHDRPTRHAVDSSTPFMAPPQPTQALVGRGQLFSAIKHRLLNGEDQGLVVLSGLPGVGKSMLALGLAHDPEILNHFRDGVLWAGLGRQPDVWALLSGWAAALGISAEVIAGRANWAELAGAVHAAIGLRRILLIVDDAWQVEALLAFKVGGPYCAQLATTRLPDVAGSVAGDQVITVHELDQEDGLTLLTQLSPRAVELAPAEARALVQSVGGLPLALTLMGRYLHKQSYNSQSRRLREALTNLQATDIRLQLGVPNPPLDTHPDLPPGTPLSLQLVIGLSDAALDATAHRALIDLAAFSPKPNSFSEDAALAVAVISTGTLDQLVEHGLIEPIEPDRYTLHQTIADYAALQRVDQTALERLIGYFTHYVETNIFDYPALDMELGNILSTIEVAFKLDRYDELIRLIKALYSFLETRGLYQSTEQFLIQGGTLAEVSGDKVSQATFLQKLGDLAIKRGQFSVAQNYLRQSIDLAKATQSRHLEADALLSLGLACSYAGNPLGGHAEPVFLEHALRLAREIGYPACECFVLDALGYVHEELCNYPKAMWYLNQALPVSRENRNRRAEGWAHFNLGTVELAVGNFAQAEDQSQRCLQIYREIGDRRGEGWIIYQLGRIYRQLGQSQAARTAFEEALQILSDLGDLMGQGFSIHNLGLIEGESGAEGAALDRFEQARSIFRRIDCVKGESQTIYSLGVMRRKCGDYGEAKTLLEQALLVRRGTGHSRGQSKALVDLGMVLLQLGDDRSAIDYGQQAVHIAEYIGARPTLGYNLTLLGHIWADLERWDEAAKSYQHAVNVRRELGQRHLLPEPLVGLAQACFIEGDTTRAKTLVNEALEYIAFKTTPQVRPREWAGADSPKRFYLTCGRILDAVHDPRAELVLKLLND